MYKRVSVEGKGGIRATIILDSISSVTGSRMVTYEIECHRFIWAEMLTHKMLSRNAASSRAIPVAKMFDQCKAEPIYWGKNQSGMQAGDEISGMLIGGAKEHWRVAKTHAIHFAQSLLNIGLHKQHANRLTEPFQMMKAVVSATEWDNFFWLRNHEAAQPEIHELARCMYEARKQSVPQTLNAGEWHLPFLYTERNDDGLLMYGERRLLELKFYSEYEFIPYTVEDALKVSAARCAAVSFRNSDYGLEKSREVWERLVGDERKHSSACEHQAFVLPKNTSPFNPETWHEAVSHVSKDGMLWSGNLKGWGQLRKMIDGECCKNYEEAISK